jgi:hypothetical protein
LIESSNKEKGDHAQKIAIRLRERLAASAMNSQEEGAWGNLDLLPLIPPKDLTVMTEDLVALITVGRGEEISSQIGGHQSSIRTVSSKLT